MTIGSRPFGLKPGKALALAALAGALMVPGPAAAQGPEIGKIIPHMLEVPDQDDQVRNFRALTRKNGLILLFSRSLAW